MKTSTLTKIFTTQNELTPSNIRGKIWPAILIFPLTVILGDLRFYDLKLQYIGLQSYELMLFPLGLGWLTLSFIPKRIIIPTLKTSALLCAIILPFQLLMPNGTERFIFFIAFQFLNGVCAAAAFNTFCFTLNNVERFFGMALIQFYYGFYYTVWRSCPAVSTFGKTYGGVIIMALYLITVFCLRKKHETESPPDNNTQIKDNAVPLALGLHIAYYLIMCMINYIEWADSHVHSLAYGTGQFTAVALAIIIHLFINRSALYSWLLFLFLSLLGLGALIFESKTAILGGSFSYGLGEGLGYIIIYYICAGAIKQSKSLKMYRLFCLVIFAEYFVISGLLAKAYEQFTGQSNILALGIVITLSGLCFLLLPYLQKKLFEAPWTDGLKLADIPEYTTALAETEKLDEHEHLGLSPREKEIFTMLLTDVSRKEIASTLKIAYVTVNYHIKNLYRKLGIQSRTGLLTKFGKK